MLHTSCDRVYHFLIGKEKFYEDEMDKIEAYIQNKNLHTMPNVELFYLGKKMYPTLPAPLIPRWIDSVAGSDKNNNPNPVVSEFLKMCIFGSRN